MNQLRILSLLFLTLFTSIPALAAGLADQTYARIVDDKGEIQLPQNFRLQWTHLGSWVVADEKAPGYGFHDVYTQPDAAQGYLAKGEFPDGSVLVKEIRKVGTGPLTTGHGQWATDTVMWFVMVKDAKQRFDNAHWAEGWGWALYQADDPGKNVSASFAETCQGCHLPAKDTDWVFVDGYPTLKH